MSTATVVAPDDAVARHLEEHEKFEGRPPAAPDAVADLRRLAIRRFGELGFPHRKMEAWRFLDLKPMLRTGFTLAERRDGLGGEELEPYRYPGCHQVVTVNGRFAPAWSDLEGLPEGVIVTGLGEAIERHPDRLEPWLGRLASFEEHAFVALNTAFLADGVFVWVPKGVVMEKPLNLISVGRAGAEPLSFFPRNLFVAGENSQVTIVEQYATLGEGIYLNSPVTEVVAGPNAVLDHYKLQRESPEIFHLATFQIHQERDSNVSSHSISWGGGLVRNDVNAVLDGEGCDSVLNGLYMVQGKQVIDNHMRVDHAKPHCDSHELYKGILEDRARAVFNGLIHVHPGAQKTDAKQTNRNLLLSREALVNSNPQLEIFADDVRCTHGSTTGHLDDVAIFYLRSRGIGDEAARSLLTYAFAADIVQRIKVAPVRHEVEEFLFRRLPRGEVVSEAVHRE